MSGSGSKFLGRGLGALFAVGSGMSSDSQLLVTIVLSVALAIAVAVILVVAR
jgi:hypothetical protein